jgi:hypothetical protein
MRGGAARLYDLVSQTSSHRGLRVRRSREAQRQAPLGSDDRFLQGT